MGILTTSPYASEEKIDNVRRCSNTLIYELRMGFKNIHLAVKNRCENDVEITNEH